MLQVERHRVPLVSTLPEGGADAATAAGEFDATKWQRQEDDGASSQLLRYQGCTCSLGV